LNHNGSTFVLMGVDVASRHHSRRKPLDGKDERPNMSRVRYGSRAANRLSRRRVLAIAATAGVGVSVAGVAGLSLAGETPGSADSAPLVISLRDAQKGTFDIFSGESKATLTDKKLAERLLKAVHR
jgi:hypothetical protein